MSVLSLLYRLLFSPPDVPSSVEAALELSTPPFHWDTNTVAVVNIESSLWAHIHMLRGGLEEDIEHLSLADRAALGFGTPLDIQEVYNVDLYLLAS